MGILAQKQKRGSSAGHRMLATRVRRGRGCEGRWRVVGVRGMLVARVWGREGIGPMDSDAVKGRASATWIGV